MLTPTENVCKYQLTICIFCENFQNYLVKEQITYRKLLKLFRKKFDLYFLLRSVFSK